MKGFSSRKHGDLIAFHIPKNVSVDDLAHLDRITVRKKAGRSSSISDFFFTKLSEDRIMESKSLALHLPDLTEKQITMLNHPITRAAIEQYAYMLLKSQTPTVVKNVKNKKK